MRITQISLEESLGKPLAHDLTKIDAKKHKKMAMFKKGQIITEEDLPILRDMGKEHISILELTNSEMHEDNAAAALRDALLGENCSAGDVAEGRITIYADCDGLLSYNPQSVHRINEDPDWVLATTAPHRQVRRGQAIAGFRILPLAMEKHRVERAVSTASRMNVKPFRPLRAGLVTTGREIAEGRVEDAFSVKFSAKISAFGGTLIGQRFTLDDAELIAAAIRGFLSEGAEVVVCTGGMSVDADDRTPRGIGLVAKKIAFRGAPILPGAMLMLGWADSINSCDSGGNDVAILGAPACVVHDERTALDCMLPFIFAGENPTPYVRQWGVGGLCEGCAPCHWPSCSFSSDC
ncbi:MAG: molybdopterin-binding protein [Synergistaceae bacterium]|jgi:molybdopterin biosynthesis enzyme|nr:molybdopterin-binding protein [Synergistaceae bacterium]